MHPEIKKFYEESSDRDIVCWGQGAHQDEVCFYKNGDQTIPNTISKSNPNIIAWQFYPHNIEYKLNGKWYSEEEMLKLIKLKAFL